MSNKRPLSPESTNGAIIDTNTRLLKRLKLHSIIQELRNEEANLVLLKKLRTCQQLATRTNNASTTNGFHSTATRIPTNKPPTPVPPVTNTSRPSSVQQPVSLATRKTLNSVNQPLPTKIPTPTITKPSSAPSPTIYSLEERKTQAKKALRAQLERDLLNIPSPKPLLRDILFIPNPISPEFQLYIGLEDVVQCLYELQTDRQRLPQRFTDRALIDEPYICDQCGTDFTIRWWKHLNNNQQTNILCDRCKKQVIRRTSKSEHSALLKNVFVSAMEQEKEIEKTFQVLIKQQQKNASRSSSSSSTTKPVINNNRPTPSLAQSVTSIPTHNQQQQQKPKPKLTIPPPSSSSIQPQNFATKISQQSTSLTNATRKSNVISQPQINPLNHNRALSHNKTPMPAHQSSHHHHHRHHHHHHHQQQQLRTTPGLPQQIKPTQNQIVKPSKTATRQQQVVPTARPIYHQPTTSTHSSSTIHSVITSSSNVRPTATKRRTIPTVNMK